MKRFHLPRTDLRYWIAITLSSIFGTNSGDLYAHNSGLGLMQGATVLAVIVAAVFAVERFDNRRHQVYYWLVIILVRTGATNIADYLAYVAKVPPVALGGGIAGLLCLFAWGSARDRSRGDSLHRLPRTGAAYWLAMLAAGVFGTLAGDLCSSRFGQGVSSLALGTLLAAVLLLGRQKAMQFVGLYWGIIAVARTTGTAMGDWLAENRVLHIGLALSTLITGTAFAAVLVLWRSRPLRAEEPALPFEAEAH